MRPSRARTDQRHLWFAGRDRTSQIMNLSFNYFPLLHIMSATVRNDPLFWVVSKFGTQDAIQWDHEKSLFPHYNGPSIMLELFKRKRARQTLKAAIFFSWIPFLEFQLAPFPSWSLCKHQMMFNMLPSGNSLAPSLSAQESPVREMEFEFVVFDPQPELQFNPVGNNISI